MFVGLPQFHSYFLVNYLIIPYRFFSLKVLNINHDSPYSFRGIFMIFTLKIFKKQKTTKTKYSLHDNKKGLQYETPEAQRDTLQNL